MSTIVYQAIDLFLFVFHTTWVLFNTLGWIFQRFRRYHLITLALTAFSWFVLGIWYGWGYCICTDWHWTVRERLGYEDHTHSYIDLLLMKITGIAFDDALIDQVTAVVFFASIFLSVWLNIRDFRKGQRR